MTEKTLYGDQVGRVATSLGVDKVMVKDIIDSYLYLCREDLIRGYAVKFFGLVRIVPTPCKGNSGTTAYFSKIISSDDSIPYYTVFSVIKMFLKNLQEDAIEGKSVTLLRLVTLHPSKEGVRSACSVSLREETRYAVSDAESFRAFTCPLLKRKVVGRRCQEELTG